MARERAAGRRGLVGGVFLVAAVVVVAVVGAVRLLGLGGGPLSGEPVEHFVHLHGLAVPPWAPEEVYVSTHQGLIHIDADGAWRFVSEVPHDFMGFAANPTRPGVLYSSGHPAFGSGLVNPIGFMVSTDSGATWTPRALEGQVDFHAMAVQPTDGAVVYGWDAGMGLLRSTDEGHTWEEVAADAVAEAGGAVSLAVDPVDRDRVLAGTAVGLLESVDGGVTWTPLLELPVTAVATAAGDPQRVLAYSAADAGLLESRDGGATWMPLLLVLPDDQVAHLAVHPTDPDTILAGSFGASLYRTTDGGRMWEQLARAGEPRSP